MTLYFWLAIFCEILLLAGLVWLRIRLNHLASVFKARKTLWLTQLATLQTQARRTATQVEEQSAQLTDSIADWQNSLPTAWKTGLLVFKLVLNKRKRPATA